MPRMPIINLSSVTRQPKQKVVGLVQEVVRQCKKEFKPRTDNFDPRRVKFKQLPPDDIFILKEEPRPRCEFAWERAFSG